ncbi:MAG: quinone oxidoreductase [Pelagibacteraceae bacterium]|nr:quinone oxidoreductase [Pelagibacteraceae bacterium]
MSKSVIINKHGGSEVLELKDVSVPSPGPEQIKVKNLAIGLNYIDTYHRSGLYPIKLPCGIGLEGAGVIQEVGSGVKNFSKGDDIAYAALPLGSYSDERVIPEKIAVKIPDGITHKIAASIMTKGLTAYYLLYKTYKVSANETLLFHAAAGGVGQIFCQWAKSIGCKLIGTVGSDEKVDMAKKNGCDFVINYRKEDFDKKVLEITENKGVDVVYDGVGKDTFEKSINCLKVRGMMVSFGNSSGSLNLIDVKKYIVPKSIFFTRPALMNYMANRNELGEGTQALFKQIKFGKVKIKIFKEYNLSDVRKAHEDLESRKIIGPAILIPNE